MGYYANFDYEIGENTYVDLNKAYELEKYFSNDDNDSLYGFYGVKLEIENDRLIGIRVNDYYAKFYDSDTFAEKLQECLVSGSVRLFFIGEDGLGWGYLLNTKEVVELHHAWLTSEELATVYSYRKGEKQ